MLYHLYETQRSLMEPFTDFAQAASKLFSNPLSPFSQTPMAQRMAAGYDLLYRDGIAQVEGLPGAMANTRQVLRFLAESLSPRLPLSLMAQYNPTPLVATEPPLDRRLLPAEYAEAVAEMERLGFMNGWVQEEASAERYNPDFSAPLPFAEESGSSRTS